MKNTNRLSIAPFDASDYLDSEETIAEYLSAALENPDPDAFLIAVRDVAKARGISAIAENAGLGRESLYKALKPGAKPRFEDLLLFLCRLTFGAYKSTPTEMKAIFTILFFPSANTICALRKTPDFFGIRL